VSSILKPRRGMLTALLAAALFTLALPAASAQASPATATCNVDDFTFGAGCSVTFPDTATGDTSTITVTLNAGLMSGNGAVGLSSTDPYYTLSNDTCTGTTLSMGGSCTFDLVFAPLDDGTAATHSRATAGLDVSEGGMPDGTLNIDAQQHTGSGGGGGPTRSGTVSPASKDFGSVTLGGSTTQTFTLTGGAATPLAVTAVALNGADAATDYTISSDDCTGATLNLGDTCDVDVVFAAPSANGATRASSATLDYTSDADTPIGVALSGTVQHHTTTRSGSIAATSGSFSGITAGATATRTFRVTGTSADAVTLGASSVTGADRADYAVTGDGCNGRTLNNGETCDIAVRFAPAASSAARSSTAELDVASNASAAISAPLSGTVVAAPAPSPGLSHTADSRSVHFRNTGNVPLHLTGAAWTGQGAENMTIVSDGCKDVTLAVGATCDVVALLKWVAYGRINAYLTVGGDATDSFSYSLPDNAYSNVRLSVSPDGGSSAAAVGDVVRKSYTFTVDPGYPPVRVASVTASGDAGFAVVKDACRGVILKQGEGCTVDTAFTITSSGSHTGTLHADGDLIAGSVSATYVAAAPAAPATPAPPARNLTDAVDRATTLLQSPTKITYASGSGQGFDLDGDHVTVIPSSILKDNAVTTVLHAEPGDTIMLNGVKLDAAGIAALQKRVQAHVYQLKTMTGSAAAVRKSQIKLLGKTCARGRCKLRLQIPKTPGVYASTIGVSHKATGRAEAYPVVAVVVPKLTAPSAVPACVTLGQRASTSSVKLGVTPATKVTWTLSAAARQPRAPRGCGDSRTWPALKASAATLARGAVAGSGASRTTSMAKILNNVRLAKLKPGFYRVRFGATSAGMRSAPLDWWIQVLPREAAVGS
jgi:hypothetical protein